jgi:hypothetical protein
MESSPWREVFVGLVPDEKPFQQIVSIIAGTVITVRGPVVLGIEEDVIRGLEASDLSPTGPVKYVGWAGDPTVQIIMGCIGILFHVLPFTAIGIRYEKALLSLGAGRVIGVACRVFAVGPCASTAVTVWVQDSATAVATIIRSIVGTVACPLIVDIVVVIVDVVIIVVVLVVHVLFGVFFTSRKGG